MRALIGKTALKLISLPFQLFSPKSRSELLARLIEAAGQGLSSKEKARFLMLLDNKLYSFHGSVAQEYGGDIHTKIKHLDYPSFFAKYLKDSETVLDIGCGKGTIDHLLIEKKPKLKITAIDLVESNISYAKKHYSHPKITFIHGDALKDLPAGKFETVILSNVMEHFEDRTGFLNKMVKRLKPKKILIRVPLFERDWRVPFKKELGVDYRLDPTHYIEYTQEIFLKEMMQANLTIEHMEIRWGEIWCVVMPRSK